MAFEGTSFSAGTLPLQLRVARVPLLHQVNVTPGPDDEADLAVLAPVLPLCAAALASGHSNTNNSLAVSTWQRA